MEPDELDLQHLQQVARGVGQLLAERDRLIVALLERKVPGRAIARAAGISPPRVVQIRTAHQHKTKENA